VWCNFPNYLACDALKTLRRMFALAFAIRVCTASGFNRSAFVCRFASPLLSPELVLGKLVKVALVERN
jgi:hypothetical protein